MARVRFKWIVFGFFLQVLEVCDSERWCCGHLLLLGVIFVTVLRVIYKQDGFGWSATRKKPSAASGVSSVCVNKIPAQRMHLKKYRLIHKCIYLCIKLWISVQLLSAIFNIRSLSSMSPRILYLFLSYYCELLWFSELLMVRDVYVSGLKVL